MIGRRLHQDAVIFYCHLSVFTQRRFKIRSWKSGKSQGISNSKICTSAVEYGCVMYIVSKNVIRRFQICKCFRGIGKFCDFMNVFMIFAKYTFIHKIAKQIMYLKSPGQLL